LVPVLSNILVITSENGAALQDWIYNLENNKSKINYDIVDVVVQGVDCPKNICEVLEQVKADKCEYDLVIIMRGGGSFTDLFGFSQPELIETVYNFNLPVLSAIGHQVDNPLLDFVADISTPTPSLAAQFIVDHNKKYISKLEKILGDIKSELLDEITEQQTAFVKLNEKLYKSVNMLSNLANDLANELRQDIGNLMTAYSQLESQVIIHNPKEIKLYNKSNQISTPNQLDNMIGQTVKLIWGAVSYTHLRAHETG
jgi:exodeoxyribonuclease VII large subunit